MVAPLTLWRRNPFSSHWTQQLTTLGPASGRFCTLGAFGNNWGRYGLPGLGPWWHSHLEHRGQDATKI